jgi:hypothetical protein
MLEEPARAWQVSELASVTDVSLGQASNVTRRLLHEEYLTKTQKRLRLIQPGVLLEAWQSQYVSPAHMLLPYYSFEREPEQLTQRLAKAGREQQLSYAVTSFAGAALVAPFVQGIGVVQAYIADGTAVDRWVSALALRPVTAGPNVLLMVPRDQAVFYRTQVKDRVAVVGNIQLYLDLSLEPARGKEQADFLRKERIGF